MAQYTVVGKSLLKDDEVAQALLGVELERYGDEVVTPQQVDSLAEQVVQWAIKYGWRWPYFILGHYAVARPLGRRADPVNFDWGALAGRLWERSKQQAIGGT